MSSKKFLGRYSSQKVVPTRPINPPHHPQRVLTARESEHRSPYRMRDERAEAQGPHLVMRPTSNGTDLRKQEELLGGCGLPQNQVCAWGRYKGLQAAAEGHSNQNNTM